MLEIPQCECPPAPIEPPFRAPVSKKSADREETISKKCFPSALTRTMNTISIRLYLKATSAISSSCATFLAANFRALHPRCQLGYSRKMQSTSWQELARLPMIDRVKDRTLVRDKAFINGEFVDGPASGSFDVIDPGNGAFLGSVPDMSEEATLLAVAAAKDAFATWRAVPARERGLILRRWYDLIVQNTDDLAVIMTSECGKPLAEVPRIFDDTIHVHCTIWFSPYSKILIEQLP